MARMDILMAETISALYATIAALEALRDELVIVNQKLGAGLPSGLVGDRLKVKIDSGVIPA